MRPTGIALPPSIAVVVRDWLSANHVVLRSPHGHVVVDTGYGRTAELTLSMLASPQALGAEPLAKIVNTHCHSDHVGGNAALQRRYGCPIALPEGEARAVREWDDKALLLEYSGQYCERYRCDEELRAGDRHVWGELEWQLLAAPGHDMGALVFWDAEHRILISGDALWEHGFGFVVPPEIDPACMPAARATLDMLATLGIRTVIPGHGLPFHGVEQALERAYRRLEAFEADSLRVARHGLKVVFAFGLLDRQRIPCREVPAILEGTGFYRDLNRVFFRQPAATLAEWLVEELLKAGAIQADGQDLIPARHRTEAG